MDLEEIKEIIGFTDVHKSSYSSKATVVDSSKRNAVHSLLAGPGQASSAISPFHFLQLAQRLAKSPWFQFTILLEEQMLQERNG